jgi:hypothetical protein
MLKRFESSTLVGDRHQLLYIFHDRSHFEDPVESYVLLDFAQIWCFCSQEVEKLVPVPLDRLKSKNDRSGELDTGYLLDIL